MAGQTSSYMKQSKLLQQGRGAHLVPIACIKSVWGGDNHMDGHAVIVEWWINKLVEPAAWQLGRLQCYKASHKLRMLLGNSDL